MNIPIDQRITFNAPEGAVTDAGRAAIEQFLLDGGWPAVETAVEWVWMNKNGTLPKRIARQLFKRRGCKLPDAIISEIGNITRRHTESAAAYTIDFTKTFDWDAGAFGETESCFWKLKHRAKDILVANGCMAVRIYHPDGAGKARAWLSSVPEGLVCWNGYGMEDSPTLAIARVLSTYLNTTYKKVALRNNGERRGLVFINGGHGYLVGDGAVLNAVELIDFHYNALLGTCEACNATFDGEPTLGPNHDVYCPAHARALLVNCSGCEKIQWRPEVNAQKEKAILFEGKLWCAECVQAISAKCLHCSTLMLRGRMLQDEYHRFFCNQEHSDIWESAEAIRHREYWRRMNEMTKARAAATPAAGVVAK